MQELELIKLAQAGQLEPFNQLVLIYQDRLYAQAYRLMGNQQEAEDATQDAFLLAFRKLAGFRGGSFKVWLLRIVTNLCYDELRRKKRRGLLPLFIADDEGNEQDTPNWLADPGDTPEQIVEISDLRRELENSLQKLPFQFRLAVVLVDVQGLGYEQAARVMGAPIGTVKSRLARARLLLQEHLQRTQMGVQMEAVSLR